MIPIPDSHQEQNAKLLQEKNAAVVLSEQNLDRNKLLETILDLHKDKERCELLQKNISSLINNDAESTIARLVYNLL